MVRRRGRGRGGHDPLKIVTGTGPHGEISEARPAPPETRPGWSRPKSPTTVTAREWSESGSGDPADAREPVRRGEQERQHEEHGAMR